MSYEQNVKLLSDREREPRDNYPSPVEHVRSALTLIPDGFVPDLVIDPGAGSGIWGAVARERWPQAFIAGVEIFDQDFHPDAYDFWLAKDYLAVESDEPWDLIIGNPPYSDAEAFIRKSLPFLREGGYLVFILRLAFLESRKRAYGLWSEYPPQIVGVYPERPSFTNNGRTDATAYCAMLWQKGWHGDPKIVWLSVKNIDIKNGLCATL